MTRDSVTPGKTVRTLATILFVSLTTGACGMFAGTPESTPITSGTTPVGDFSKFDEDALVRMAERFESAEDYGSAMRMYGQALEKNSKSVPALLGIARIYSAGGVTEQAETYYRHVLAIEPGNPDAAAGLGGQMIVADRGADAITFLNNFVNEGHRSARLYNVLGVAHDLVGDHEGAQLAYSQGLDMAPENPDILNNMALSFAIAGQYDTAIALLQEQVNNPAQRSVARQNLALVYALSGDLDAAEGIAKTELTPEQVATNRAFYSQLATLSSRDRARAVYLRRLPTLEEQQTEAEASQAESAAPQQGLSGQTAAPEAQPTAAPEPSRPLTAAERAEAIIRARQSTDESESANKTPARPGFEVPGADMPQSAKAEAGTESTAAAETTLGTEESPMTSAPADEAETSTDAVMQKPAPQEAPSADEAGGAGAAADQMPAEEPANSDTIAEEIDESPPAMTEEPATETSEPDAAEDATEMTTTDEAESTGASPSGSAEAPMDAALENGATMDAAEAAAEPRYWIQVGSYRNPDKAKAGWNTLVSQHSDMLGGLTGHVQHFTDDDGKVFYRLFAAGYPGFTAANQQCAAFLAGGVGCFVIDTTDDISPLADTP